MMKDEQNWSKTDVRNLKTDIFEQVLLQCYKHQLFKTSAAVKRINRGTYSERSVMNWLDATKAYLFRGVKYSTVSPRFYTTLDKFKASHVAILAVSEADKYQIPTNIKVNPPTPSIKIHPQAKKMIKEIQKINYPKYGVKYENTIKVFDNKDFCLGYIECFTELNKEQKAELIKVNYELVVEENENNDGNA